MLREASPDKMSTVGSSEKPGNLKIPIVVSVVDHILQSRQILNFWNLGSPTVKPARFRRRVLTSHGADYLRYKILCTNSLVT